jgi:lipopolysaccharide export system protein LptA
VTGVQQAEHVGDDCEKHFTGNVNVTKDSIKIT